MNQQDMDRSSELLSESIVKTERSMNRAKAFDNKLGNGYELDSSQDLASE